MGWLTNASSSEGVCYFLLPLQANGPPERSLEEAKQVMTREARGGPGVGLGARPVLCLPPWSPQEKLSPAEHRPQQLPLLTVQGRQILR